MNTIASRDQVKPIRTRENLVVNYIKIPIVLLFIQLITLYTLDSYYQNLLHNPVDTDCDLSNSTIQWINHYPMDKYDQHLSIHPVDSDFVQWIVLSTI